jgi:glycosyltransferase involved in cell wall biosynthesis
MGIAMDRNIVVAHDWTTNYAGSERVVEQLLRMYPSAPLLTSISAEPPLPFLKGRSVRTSFVQKAPSARHHWEYYLPLMPLAWRSIGEVTGVDAVVSSSHACAHAVRLASDTPQLNYCHTPMRYAWDFESEKDRFPLPYRPLARHAMRWFRRWDRKQAQTVTEYVANSTAVAERIARYYSRAARIIHPPVDVDFFTPSPEGREHEPYFLYVGRLVSYKRADLAVEAFAELPFRLVVVGQGHLGPRLRQWAPPNITFREDVTRADLRELYRHATALVFPADEDFGIAMAEAIACGTPVISLNRGGARDIVEVGRNGWLMETDEASSLKSLAWAAAKNSLSSTDISSSASRFSPTLFRQKMHEAVEEMIEGFHRSGARRGGHRGSPREASEAAVQDDA